MGGGGYLKNTESNQIIKAQAYNKGEEPFSSR